MVDPVKKSTEAVQEVVWKCDAETVLLDSRLALYAKNARWLALSDLHYGYEVRRRAKGGLWPMWGRETIENRIDDLLKTYQPETLILNGDIVDGTSSGGPEAISWLKSLEDRCNQLILIEGNHDQGAILRELDFVRHYQTGKFIFHHGHMPIKAPKQGEIEVIGHIHPSIKFNDGAGLSIKCPSLIQQKNLWIMPAFSPWAGGVPYKNEPNTTQWACSPKRIFQNL